MADSKDGIDALLRCRTKDSAERAVKDANPIIDGRKANVNLAYLGAKPRINAQNGFPSIRPPYSFMIGSQYGLMANWLALRPLVPQEVGTLAEASVKTNQQPHDFSLLNYASHQRDLANLLVGANLHVGFALILQAFQASSQGKSPSSVSAECRRQDREEGPFELPFATTGTRPLSSKTFHPQF
ncbi:RNA-binding protein 38 [Caerostris extrusa]|uniref:RNA-binding protein 38 n=1 Tax=Caerostris extrusa TaxID=172846 RepID=A0AAV4N4G9_CAEEX|nr:RNA-binding protein 38 [Caerostris extrusa]